MKKGKGQMDAIFTMRLPGSLMNRVDAQISKQRGPKSSRAAMLRWLIGWGLDRMERVTGK